MAVKYNLYVGSIDTWLLKYSQIYDSTKLKGNNRIRAKKRKNEFAKRRTKEDDNIEIRRGKKPN